MYEWTDRWPVLYTNWGQGEPVDGTDRGCVAMNDKGRWNKTECNRQQRYICKTTTGKNLLNPFCTIIPVKLLMSLSHT